MVDENEKTAKLMGRKSCVLLRTLQLTAVFGDEAPDSELGVMAEKKVSRDP